MPAAPATLALGLVLAGSAGCDAAPPAGSLGIGPPLHVVGFNGAGQPAPDGGASGANFLPADAIIQIAFDRLLHPSSVTRQSFQLASESGTFPEPVVTYDPVARVVTLSSSNPTPGPWLTPGVTYTVTIGVSAANDYIGGSGPRAIDGAVMAEKVTEVFQVIASTTPTQPADRTVSFCDDVIPIFQRECSGGLCHAASDHPAEGLILETPDGILNTLVGATPRVSQESNTGGLAQPASAQGRLFGVDMPLVSANAEPGSGNPGASWLMYKVLLGQLRPIDDGLDAGAATCGEDGSVPAPVLQLPTPQPNLMLSPAEQQILSQYILGNQMPYPLNIPANEATPASEVTPTSSTLPLTFQELERIRAWIAQGAVVTQCTSCPQ